MNKLSPIIVSCLAILVYSNTFSNSFHFDDFTYIAGNPVIRNFGDLAGIWNYYPCRFLTFLSFAFNYYFSQLNVFGYHLFNLAVHIVSSILVWWLVLLTLSTPAMKGNKITRHAAIIALWAGLVFASHPVQTEAVNYICQRAASMAALFYLASLCFYVKSRLLQNSVIASASPAKGGEAKQSFKKIATTQKIYYTCSLIAAIAAMFTKENAVTLPLMILLYEFSFLKTGKRLDWKYLFPFLLSLLIIPLTMLLTRSRLFHEIHYIAHGPRGISSFHYLLTQCRVMLTYVRLAFLPFNQNLDYDYPVYKDIFELPVLSGILFLAAVFFCAKKLFAEYRLLSFSIFWFFLTLLPESSLLPARDLIYEHRLYLPLAGYSLFIVSSVYYIFGVIASPKGEAISNRTTNLMVIALSLIVACYSLLTYQRNKIWMNEFVLWDDAVKKSPHKARPYMSRGSEYFQQGDFVRAMSDYNKAIELDPRYVDVYVDRSAIYDRQGKLDLAISDSSKAIEINPNHEGSYFNRGKFYAEQGNYVQAIQDYTNAIEINPHRAEAYSHRGDSYVRQGDYLRAIQDYTSAIGIDPAYAEAYGNRGAVYAGHGDFTAAIHDLNKAIEIDPAYAQAYINRAGVYYTLREYDMSWMDVREAEKLGGVVSSQLLNMLKSVSIGG